MEFDLQKVVAKDLETKEVLFHGTKGDGLIYELPLDMRIKEMHANQVEFEMKAIARV